MTDAECAALPIAKRDSRGKLLVPAVFFDGMSDEQRVAFYRRSVDGLLKELKATSVLPHEPEAG